MNTMPLALIVKVRVSASAILKDKNVHDMAHQFLEEMLRARLRIGSTPPGVPCLFSAC